MENLTVEQIREMNIYEKVQNCRVMMQEEGIKKQGKNTFAKYDYYKLADLNATMNKALNKFRLCTKFEVSQQIAMLTIVDVDHPEQEMFFSMPFIDAEMAKVTKIQNWGSSVSYLQRYLILEAFQIGECEIDVDSTEASENRAKDSKKKDKAKQEPKVDPETGEIIETLESVKKEVTDLCKSLSDDGKRPEVNKIVSSLNPNKRPNPASITDIEILKQIRVELNNL
jgi:hypothetical protein|nr:MAG TPA: ERF superfamily protein [Caudoviricetes sp.]